MQCLKTFQCMAGTLLLVMLVSSNPESCALGCVDEGTSAVDSPVDVESRPAGKSPTASIEDVSWIAGQWTGEALGGRFEETWNSPSAGGMVGMFKLTRDGDVSFYELLTIVPEGESLVLRLKHFGSDLVGWEEKDKSVEFPLVAIRDNEAQFNGLTFRKIDNDEMLITVNVKSGGEVQELRFECHRAKQTDDSGTRISAADAVLRVYRIDRIIAKQRDHLPEKATLAIAVHNYVLGLDSIDYSDCSADFSAAFMKHRDAWNDSIPFFESHDDLHGEMHELFDQIKELDNDASRELEHHFKSIMDTWKEVETAAHEAGVKG